ncbi:MAG: hypothetical protein LBT26_10485 [Clostridiales Family XIII bacterium]|jgi:cell filamentation protein|nr:hypothetical protein [Clostridiales Family XIII bacterium]
MDKISIRFFDDKEVRAGWDDEGSKWWFSVVDIVGVLSQSSDSRNYWYVLKIVLKRPEAKSLQIVRVSNSWHPIVSVE